MEYSEEDGDSNGLVEQQRIFARGHKYNVICPKRRATTISDLMGAIDAKLTKLQHQAHAGEVEVEDLLKFAILGDTTASPVIKELCAEYQWPRVNEVDGSHVVPLGRWAEVICAYLDGGSAALVAYARQPESDSLYFAAAVMEEVKSTASVHGLSELARDLLEIPSERARDCYILAGKINHALSFKDAPAISVADADTVREFLHRLLRREASEPELVSIICALRGVGDEESISLVKRLPPFEGAYAGLQSSVTQAIRETVRRRRAALE